MVTPGARDQRSVNATTEPVHEPAAAETGHLPARSLAQLESSQTAMRDATKWLVAAAGAVGAIVVAGLQLRDLPRGSVATLVALLGVGAALLAVAFVLYRAAGVLAPGYTTFGSITDLDAEVKFERQRYKEAWWADRIERLYAAKMKQQPTPERLYQILRSSTRRLLATGVIAVMKAVRILTRRYAKVEDVRIDVLIDHLNQNAYFFTQGIADNIHDLFGALREADEEILSIRGERIGGEVTSPNPASLPTPETSSRTEELTQAGDSQALLERADWRRDRLERAVSIMISLANQRLLERRFRKLIFAICFGGGIVAIGAGAFAAAPKLGKPQPLSITQPTRVSIRVIGEGLGRLCPRGTLLQGVAIGGTWEEPVVVTEGAGSCPALQVTLNPDQAIVVPVFGPSP